MIIFIAVTKTRAISITEIKGQELDLTTREELELKIDALIKDPRTYIEQSAIAGDITVQNSSSQHGSWARIKLFQLAENHFAVDGSGIRFVVLAENLPEKLKDHFVVINQNFINRSKKTKIAILDYGSQYTGNIASVLRKASGDAGGMEVEFFDQTLTYDELQPRIDAGEIKGIIISGGPASVNDDKSPQVDRAFFTKAKIPVLGICYGMQAMADALGGKVSNKDGAQGEYGPTEIEYLKSNSLNQDLQSARAIMSHKDTVIEVPIGFEIMAKTSDIEIAAMANEEKKLYAIQFHPEVSPAHQKLLVNFATKICALEVEQNHYDEFIELAIKNIKKTVAGDEVFLAVSGGVDSTVLAFLLNKAIGKQAHFYIVDNGFMRKGEVEKSLTRFSEMNIDLKVLNVADEFFAAVKNIDDPELKRKAIGAKFIDVFADAVKDLNASGHKIKFLAQGTILSDVMESGKKKYDFKTGELVDIRDTVKSHHNVGGLPDELKNLDLLEPLKDLFKDEVRIIGKKLQVPSDLLFRRPFPGPGLAIRVPHAEANPQRIEKVKEANFIFDNSLAKSKNAKQVWQSLVALLIDSKACLQDLTELVDINSSEIYKKLKGAGVEILASMQLVKVVGSKGDGRSHEYPIAIKVKSGEADMQDLRSLAREITNRSSANRVLLELINDNSIENNQALVMRAIDSLDAMTATVVDLSDIYNVVAKEIQRQCQVARVYYDITDKPPGTVEFE